MINGKKINDQLSNPLILVAPLDWGLGHVTRCIPIIIELLNQGCRVILAVNRESALLLKKEFPGVEILQIVGYNVQYSRNKKWLSIKLMSQLPKIVLAILKENRWLKTIVKQYNLNAVISDNRFGMYNGSIASVYITHQLDVKSGNYFSNKISSLIHKIFIKKYTQCWIPDFKKDGLAGELSHTGKPGSNIKYIGPLSRFEKLTGLDNKFDLLVCISGPEPQRKIFEDIIFSQLKSYEGRALVVRGLPAEDKEIISSNDSIEIVNHLSANDLNKAFQQSKCIVCRSGYTTIMDLVKIGKQAILVPTPGQTEQEYLAEYLMRKKFFFSVEQQCFLLSKAIGEASVFPFVKYKDEMEGYKKVVAEFVLSLKTGKFATQ